MSIVHMIVGDHAADLLKRALADQADTDFFVIKDVFNVGPLRSEELSFAALRTEFWRTVTGDNNVVADDLNRLMELSTQLSNEQVKKIFFWMSGIPADVCSYFWLLHFMKKHLGKVFVININGLPFLDDENRLFYPQSIAELPLRQVHKALRLARAISPSEWETDGDEWKRLIFEENAGVRIVTGAKQVQSKPIDFYDKILLEQVNQNNQKIARVVAKTMEKHQIHTGDLFLIWRLREMQVAGLVSITKDTVSMNKNL
ncbi:MAG TPA: DUF3658 domain-containing protein [Edaphocola sp.]|nr:DUF3658 domain-containing protein [Edaphocola sp.]